jgi:glycosyltransferase involved in cell wall biosynthesis
LRHPKQKGIAAAIATGLSNASADVVASLDADCTYDPLILSPMLRLLTSAPPGRLSFTIFDPVGLGQNFAGIMHLADFEERLINSRIWTQTAQFEQRLADLNEHIGKSRKCIA